MNPRLKKIDAMETSIAEQKTAYDDVTKVLDEVKQANDALVRRQMLGIGSKRVARGGQVSEDCARWLGGLTLLAGINQGRLTGKVVGRWPKSRSKISSALTPRRRADHDRDIPMPTDYLPGDRGAGLSVRRRARRLCTVFPMGTLTVKLPKLTTDTQFGLIASSGTVTEKSPQIVFVSRSPPKNSRPVGAAAERASIEDLDRGDGPIPRALTRRGISRRWRTSNPS